MLVGRLRTTVSAVGWMLVSGGGVEITVARKSAGNVKCRLVFGTFDRPRVLRFYAPVVCNSPGITTCCHGTVGLPTRFSVVRGTRSTRSKHVGLLTTMSRRIGMSVKLPASRSKTTTVGTLSHTVASCHGGLCSILVATPMDDRGIGVRKCAFGKRGRCVRAYVNSHGDSLDVLVKSSLHVTTVARGAPLTRMTNTVDRRDVIDGAALL